MIRAPKQFVCADCNEIVLRPTNQNGFLRCPQGHRVQGLTARPVLFDIAITLFLALCASGLLIGVGNAVTGNATIVATIVSALFAAWAVFLFSRGVKFRRAASPTALLANQYLASGMGFLFFAILIVCGVTAGVFRW